MDQTVVETFVAAYSDRMHKIHSALGTATWELSTTGSDEVKRRLVDLEIQYNALFRKSEDFELLRSWYGAREQIRDSDRRRETEHLYHAFLANREEPDLARQLAELRVKIDAAFMGFRSTFHGKQLSENDLRDILKSSTDSDEVRDAWEASKQVGSHVHMDVIQLVELRNRKARALGYRDYYAFSLAIQEIDEAFLLELLDSLERDTRGPFEHMKADLDTRLAQRFGVAVADLRPWHYRDPFFQEVPALESNTMDGLFETVDPESIGLETFARAGMDVSDILARSDLYERPQKDQHAFCLHVDRLTDDVRVLCNLRRDEYWTATILHELGHAVYDKYLERSLPFLLREAAHTSTTEAIAMLFGRFTADEMWLASALGVSANNARSALEETRRRQRFVMLLFVRWTLVLVHFERALYANPARADLNRLWWDLVEQFQLLRRPERRDKPDWAAKIHVALYPVYYQNYVLGELTASQIQDALLRDLGSIVDNPAVGPWLSERLFSQGSRYTWNDTVRRATGQELTTRHFANQFIAG